MFHIFRPYLDFNNTLPEAEGLIIEGCTCPSRLVKIRTKLKPRYHSQATGGNCKTQLSGLNQICTLRNLQSLRTRKSVPPPTTGTADELPSPKLSLPQLATFHKNHEDLYELVFSTPRPHPACKICPPQSRVEK